MRRFVRPIILGLILSLGSGCAGNFKTNKSTIKVSASEAEQKARQGLADNAVGVSIEFKQDDLYSVTDPNANQCAGDHRTFYWPFTTDPSTGRSLAFAGGTKPAFLQGVSSTLTNTGTSSSWNQSFTCSIAASFATYPSTGCAAYDVGPLYGIGSDLSGSIFLAGQSSYALGIDRVPAEEPLSALLPMGQSSVMASALEGARAAASKGTRSKILLSGGAEGKSWLFDTQTQQWSNLTTIPTTSAAQTTQFDRVWNGTAYTNVVNQSSKQVPPVTDFNFFGAPFFGFQRVSRGNSTILVNPANTSGDGAERDRTERLIIAGGSTDFGLASNRQFLKGMYKFNPTFGPDLVDVSSLATNNPFVAQWLEPFPTQPLHNERYGKFTMDQGIATNPNTPTLAGASVEYFYNTSNLAPYLIRLGGRPSTAFDWSMSLSSGTFDFFGGSTCSLPAGPAGAISFSGIPNWTHTGSFTSSYNVDAESFLDPTTLRQGIHSFQNPTVVGGGNSLRFLGGSWCGFNTAIPSNFSSPIAQAAGGKAVPFFRTVGSTTTRGMAYFGGANCRDYYLSDGVFCSDSASLDFAPNTQTNLVFPNPAFTPGMAPTSVHSNNSTVTANSPARAGLAAAAGLMGLASQDQQLVVAWGGIRVPNEPNANADTIFYMTSNGSAPPATWNITQTSTPPSGERPPHMTNSAMVFSHVTKKFYLFGGRLVATGTAVSDLYELTPNCTGTPISCAFSWRKLNPTGTIPSPRWGAGFAQVDYNNTDPNLPTKTCLDTQPCSLALFLQGGALDGSSIFGDRYVFDPTANNSQGHWTRVNDFPPRENAVMASFKVVDQRTGAVKQGALMFGGEMSMAAPGTSFVKPILADTWMFDFGTQTWGRAELLGRGVVDYSAYTVLTNDISEWERRQLYDIEATGELMNLTTLAPPPLAGAMAITRDRRDRPIPEVYVFGGRTKTGALHALTNVFKFCPYSTGEKDTGSGAFCDAYDPQTNPLSPSPRLQTPSGRWLSKVPPTGSSFESYLGAAAYDSRRDKALVFGGLGSGSITSATTITQTSALNINEGNNVLEYTFPTIPLDSNYLGSNPSAYTNNPVAIHGRWDSIGICSGSPTPTARYGHVMSYDAAQDQIIITGGKDLAGNLLTQSHDGATIPEIWAGKRQAANCYSWRQITEFGNTAASASNFTQGWFNQPSTTLPTTSYGSAHYAMDHEQCAGLGPFASQDPQAASQNVGGVVIDLNRSALPATENLLMHVTYIPLDETSVKGDGSQATFQDRTDFRIQLVKSGWSAAELSALFQPRHMAFYQDLVRNDVKVRNFSLMGTPGGGVREESIVLPLSALPQVNRIWIERVSGSGVLVSVKLYRLGRR